jgi:EAL domain-containing protein (putative c-di-GMP-specific phosphodiesterase class I)
MVVSVNISGPHLQSPQFLEKPGPLACRAPGLVAPNCLELEMLETAALDDMAMAADIFVACRHLGVSFALDDFRHRLLLAHLLPPPAGRFAEDRPVFRPRHARQPG